MVGQVEVTDCPQCTSHHHNRLLATDHQTQRHNTTSITTDKQQNIWLRAPNTEHRIPNTKHTHSRWSVRCLSFSARQVIVRSTFTRRSPWHLFVVGVTVATSTLPSAHCPLTCLTALTHTGHLCSAGLLVVLAYGPYHHAAYLTHVAYTPTIIL